MYNDSLTDIIDIVLERLLEGDLDIILDWDLKRILDIVLVGIEIILE